MVLIGRRLSDDELRAVRADPAMADILLDGGPDGVEPPEPELDIDKAWHGIHFLLTGTPWQVSEGAGEAVLGGDEVGADVGYGPARLLSVEAVQRVAAALAGIDAAALRARFDGAAMTAADIYPSLAWSEAADLAYLTSHYAELRHFYREAADRRQAVLLALS